MAELLATLTLMTIVMATATPSLSRVMERFELRTAAHEMLAELQWLRSQAVTSNSRHRLSRSGSSDLGYERFDVATASWVDVDRSAPIGLQHVTIGGPAEVLFLPNGAVSAAASYSIDHGTNLPTKYVSVGVAGSIRID